MDCAQLNYELELCSINLSMIAEGSGYYRCGLSKKSLSLTVISAHRLHVEQLIKRQVSEEKHWGRDSVSEA